MKITSRYVRVEDAVFGNAQIMQRTAQRAWQLRPLHDEDDTYEACLERVFRRWAFRLDEAGTTVFTP